MRAPTLMMLAAAVGAADPLTLVLPQTIHQPVGGTTALRGGAAYAFGTEAAATWYNPALAAGLDRQQLSAGATAYGFNNIRVSAGRESDALLSGAVLKVYGGISGRSPGGDWGFAALVCNPVHWSGAVDSGRSAVTASERSYSTQVRVDQDTWSAQAAAGWNAHERVRLGFAVLGNYDTVDLIQNAWVRDSAGRYEAISTTAAGWSVSLQAKLGLTWQPSEKVSLGLAVVTPGVGLLSNGLASETVVVNDPAAGTATTADARVDSDAFSFLHAWQVGLGAGLHEPGWEVELDLVWTLPDPTEDTVPALPGFRSDTSGGTTTITPLVVPARTTSYRHVVNARIGGGIELSERMVLHLGAFTDFSPVGASDIYNTVDFFGASAGVMWRRGETGLVIGLSATWGHEGIELFNPATNTVTKGDLDVFAMDALIGTVTKF